MVIKENSNLNEKSYCNIGQSYELPIRFIKDSEEARKLHGWS
jgi:hypothetical protein